MMRKGWGRVFLAGVALAVLPACDGVKWPGFSSSREDTDEDIPPPPPDTPVDEDVTGGDTPDGGTTGDGGGEDGDVTGTPDDGTGDNAGGDGPTDASDPVTNDGGETPVDGGTDTPTGVGTDAEPGTGTDTDTDTDTDTGDVTGPAPDPDPEPDPEPTPEPTFSFLPAGYLQPGTGDGATDDTVFAPDMVFPLESAPAYPQTQVYRPGGQVAGDQCQASNYTYPWIDNFCETRTSNYSTPYCTEEGVHLGQDIRVGDPAGCETMRNTARADRMLYKVVAVEDGTISNVGSYTVNLRAGGRIYRYLHLNMNRLEVEKGDEVKAGDVIGYISNDFGGAATTFHLHFEIKMNSAEYGWTFVPPYSSLVAAYARREGGPGEELPIPTTDSNVGTASSPQ